MHVGPKIINVPAAPPICINYILIYHKNAYFKI